MSENIELMKKCKYWEICNTPKCPLDLDMDIRTMYGDETSCKHGYPSRIVPPGSKYAQARPVVALNSRAVVLIRRWQKTTPKNKENMLVITNKGNVIYKKADNV